MTKLITIDYDKYIKLVNPEEKASKELEELKQKFDLKLHDGIVKKASEIRKQILSDQEEEEREFKRGLCRKIRAFICANSIFGFISIKKINNYIRELEKGDE